MSSESEVTATEENFNEQAYLLANPDIAEAVAQGELDSGRQHFEAYGRQEGRKQKVSGTPDRERDRGFLAPDVPSTQSATHANWLKLMLEIGNKPGMKVLEIGSREVTGESPARKLFDKAQYVGFDYCAGGNVDVVGDAHKLSGYFDCQFDLIYSSAVFEHLAMPWIVAEEIAWLLKVGGKVFVETHFSFGSHERPWNFFQFSDMALKCLFSPALGFECLEAGMSNPIIGKFSSLADPYLRGRYVSGLYCHSQYLGVKRREVSSFNWADVDVAEVVGNTRYPAPRS